MKIKTYAIEGTLSAELDEEINEFLEGKKVHDVKLTTYPDMDGVENNNILITYD